MTTRPRRRDRPGARQATSQPVDLTRRFDVLVVGGGNAALCAAISARRAGASVLVLEAAPKFYRGGNTRHTRNMRCAHDSATEILTGPYTEEEFWDDLLRVTGGDTDEQLARFMIREFEGGSRPGSSSRACAGSRRSAARSASGARTRFSWRRPAMLNALYLTAERLGSRSTTTPRSGRSDHRGRHLPVSSRLARRRRAVDGARQALVAAAGGFEANIEWLKEYWATPAENFLIRGTPYNRGTVLKLLLDKGVSRSAIRRSATRSPSTRARRISTAASSPVSIASSSASS